MLYFRSLVPITNLATGASNRLLVEAKKFISRSVDINERDISAKWLSFLQSTPRTRRCFHYMYLHEKL